MADKERIIREAAKLRQTQQILSDRLRSGPVSAHDWLDILVSEYYKTLSTLENQVFTPQNVFPDIGRAIGRHCLEITNGRESGNSDFTLFIVGDGEGQTSGKILEEIAAADKTVSEKIKIKFIDINKNFLDKQIKSARKILPRTSTEAYLQDIRKFRFPVIDNGLVVLVEQLDTIPPHLVEIDPDGNINEVYVGRNNLDQIGDLLSEPTPFVRDFFRGKIGQSLKTVIPIDNQYPLGIDTMQVISDIFGNLKRGGVIVVDYGFDNRSYQYPFEYPGNPPYSQIFRARNVTSREDPLASMRNFAGIADISFPVDFGLVGQVAGVFSFAETTTDLWRYFDYWVGIDGMSSVLSNYEQGSQDYLQKLNELVFMYQQTYPVRIFTKGIAMVEYPPERRIPPWLLEEGNKYWKGQQ